MRPTLSVTRRRLSGNQHLIDLRATLGALMSTYLCSNGLQRVQYEPFVTVPPSAFKHPVHRTHVCKPGGAPATQAEHVGFKKRKDKTKQNEALLSNFPLTSGNMCDLAFGLYFVFVDPMSSLRMNFNGHICGE